MKYFTSSKFSIDVFFQVFNLLMSIRRAPAYQLPNFFASDTLQGFLPTEVNLSFP